MNLKEATKIVALLQTMWGNQTWHEKANVAWQMALDDVDYADAEQAVLQAFKTCKFAPTPAEIRAIIGTPESEWDAQLPTGKQAWEEIRAQITASGTWGKPRWSHPLIERTVKAFGWQEICGCDLTQMNTLRAQVERFHDGYRTDAIAQLKRGTPMDLAIATWAEQCRGQAKVAGLVPVALDAGDEWAEGAA